MNAHQLEWLRLLLGLAGGHDTHGDGKNNPALATIALSRFNDALLHLGFLRGGQCRE